MRIAKTVWGVAVSLAIFASATASATTLIRQGVDELVAGNSMIVVGEVVDAHSYWNDERTFILTDLRIAPDDIIKGRSESLSGEITVTIMGGTVDDLTTMIVAGAELLPGNSYVLFLNHEELPGKAQALTVRDHVQGVFDIVLVGGELRAISQANQHPLVPDKLGYVDAPGGVQGFPLEAMLTSLKETVKRTSTN